MEFMMFGDDMMSDFEEEVAEWPLSMQQALLPLLLVDEKLPPQIERFELCCIDGECLTFDAPCKGGERHSPFNCPHKRTA